MTPTYARRRSRGEAAFHSCPHFMEAAGVGGGDGFRRVDWGLPASGLGMGTRDSRLDPAGWSLEFGEGETFLNSSAPKTGLWELGPRPDLPRTPAGPSPQQSPLGRGTSVCCAGAVSQGCWGELGVPCLQPQTHFSKWSLHLPLLLSRAPRAGDWLAGPGFPDAWRWLPGCLALRAQFSVSSGFRGSWLRGGQGPRLTGSA